MFWHVLCLACKYFIFLLITEVAAIKQPKNLLHLPKATLNTCKIANKLMTVASAEINLQSKHDLICHAEKAKAATSAHSMADVIPCFSVFIISFRIQRFDKTKRKYILHTNKENIIRNIVLVLMFQQLLANKHHRLRHSKFGRVEAWVWSSTKLKKQEDLLDLITALLKFNCLLTTTVATQCTFQSRPWWFLCYCRDHITWSTYLLLLNHQS